MLPLIYLKIKYHRSALNSCYLLLFWDCQRRILKNLKTILYKFSEDVVWFHIIMHLLALIPLDIPPSLLFSWNEECMDYFTLVASFLWFLFLSLSLIFKIHIYSYLQNIYVYVLYILYTLYDYPYIYLNGFQLHRIVLAFQILQTFWSSLAECITLL